MVTRFVLLASALFWCAADAHAGEKLKPNQIIKKAVKAVGGKSAIEKSKSSLWKDKGTYYGTGQALPYDGVYSFQLPDKMRMEIKGIFTVVLNGNKGWTSTMGVTKPLEKKVLAVQLKDMHTHAVVSLVPFVNRKGYKFKLLGNVKVKGANTVGLLVSKKGFDDVKLYFDAKTFLLAKVSHKTINTDMNFKEVTEDSYYSDYKKIAGVMVATKIVLNQDGKRLLEMNITDFQPMPQFDAKTFSKP